MGTRALNKLFGSHPEMSVSAKLHVLFLAIYIFLSGFVFVEPSPAEVWFSVSVPFLLIGFKTSPELVLTFGLLFIPMLVSAYVGSTFFGLYNLRFIIIDVYLFLFFFVIASYLNAIKKKLPKEFVMDVLMRAWFLAGSINILAGLFVMATGMKFPISIIRFGIRLQGFFKDPNVLGPFLVPVAFYFLNTFFEKKEKQIFYLLVFIFLSFGVFITFSRAAWLNYLITLLLCLFYTMYVRNVKKRVALFVIIMVFLLFSLLFFSSRIQILGYNLYEFIKIRAQFQQYDEERFETQLMFLDILSLTSVIFGAGPGNYENFSGMSTHSLYLRYIAERGIVGFITFCVFFSLVFKKALKSHFKRFLIPSLIGQMVNSLFIDSLHWRHLWILFALSFL